MRYKERKGKIVSISKRSKRIRLEQSGNKQIFDFEDGSRDYLRDNDETQITAISCRVRTRCVYQSYCNKDQTILIVNEIYSIRLHLIRSASCKTQTCVIVLNVKL